MKKVSIQAMAIVLAISLFGGGAMAAVKNSADVVKASLVGKSVTAAPGERVQFKIQLDISERWHIYAHGDTNFIGVDLVVEEGFPLTDLQVEYPKGHQKEFFGEKVFMIEGKSEITASALVPDSLPTGGHLLALKVTAQACDDKVCLAPTRIPVVLTLMVP